MLSLDASVREMITCLVLREAQPLHAEASSTVRVLRINCNARLAARKKEDVRHLIQTATDRAFAVNVTVSDGLDWSQDLKRLFFASKVT